MATAGGRTTADLTGGGVAPGSGVTPPPGNRGAAEPPAPPGSAGARLFAEPYLYDFFQAVRLLERLAPHAPPVGGAGPPAAEPARFRALNSLSFPPSPLAGLDPGSAGRPPEMTVAFFGLTGPTGTLPRLYTDLLARLTADPKAPERYALRDWFDLFNHRLLSLFYRAWGKYRFWLARERAGAGGSAIDSFTTALRSFVGLGTPGLADRGKVTAPDTPPRTLAAVSDDTILYYAGLFAHRPRNPGGLEAVLTEYLGVPVKVEPFRGQWLTVDDDSRASLGWGSDVLPSPPVGEGRGEARGVGGRDDSPRADASSARATTSPPTLTLPHTGGGNQRAALPLGAGPVLGERVWDVQSKFRVRVGPVGAEAFAELLPDPAPLPAGKRFALVLHLARLYAGPEFDIEVQLLLKADEVPPCRLPRATAPGPRLGWNAWLVSMSAVRDAGDAVFASDRLARVENQG